MPLNQPTPYQTSLANSQSQEIINTLLNSNSFLPNAYHNFNLPSTLSSPTSYQSTTNTPCSSGNTTSLLTAQTSSPQFITHDPNQFYRIVYLADTKPLVSSEANLTPTTAITNTNNEQNMVKKRAARNRTNITNDQSTNETLLTTNHNNKNLAQTMQNNNLPNSSANIKASEKRPASTNIQVEYSNAKRVKASTNAKNSAKPIESTSSLNISATSNKTNNPAFSIANARFLSDEDLQKSEEGHLNYYRDCIIHRRFRVLRTLGQGTFGRVACVEDLEHPNKHYAMKIVRNVDKYRRAAEAEVSILKHLSKKDGMGKHLCVSMLDYFNYHGHMCIVFEKLGISVFDFLKRNDYHPYPMRQVRHMAYQLIHAVRFLHKLGITHTDLKPENMLFVTTDYDKVDCWAPGFTGVYRQMKHSNIRLIDFGSAIFDSEPHGVTVTTRHYRAPEVLMELGWSHPCDVWSVACIIFELFTGLTLFQTHDNREHLAMMERIVGNIPNVLGRKSQTGYFGRNGKLMWDKRTHPAKYVAKHCKPLHEYFKDCKPEISFLHDLIMMLFVYDPSERCALDAAIEHKFFHCLPSDEIIHRDCCDICNASSSSTTITPPNDDMNSNASNPPKRQKARAKRNENNQITNTNKPSSRSTLTTSHTKTHEKSAVVQTTAESKTITTEHQVPMESAATCSTSVVTPAEVAPNHSSNIVLAAVNSANAVPNNNVNNANQIINLGNAIALTPAMLSALQQQQNASPISPSSVGSNLAFSLPSYFLQSDANAAKQQGMAQMPSLDNNMRLLLPVIPGVASFPLSPPSANSPILTANSLMSSPASNLVNNNNNSNISAINLPLSTNTNATDPATYAAFLSMAQAQLQQLAIHQQQTSQQKDQQYAAVAAMQMLSSQFNSAFVTANATSPGSNDN